MHRPDAAGRRGQRRRHQARRGARLGRAGRVDGPGARAHGRRVEPRQGGDLRRRPELGPRARGHRRARGQPPMAHRSDARHRARAGHLRVRRRAHGRRRAGAARQDARPFDPDRSAPGRGRRARHRVGLRSQLRLREDQRRLHEPDPHRVRRHGGSRRSARQLQPRLQARAARRGAQLYRALRQYARRRKIRRRRDGEGVAQSELRQRHQPAQHRGPLARRRARRRPRDHADDGDDGARQERVRRRRCG